MKKLDQCGWKADNIRNTSVSFPFELATSFVKERLGPERKLRLEKELIIVDLNET